MRKFFTPQVALAALIICIIHSHCVKKKVEAKVNDIVVKAMISGKWYIVRFEEQGAETTGSYAPYEFKFNEDGSVQGIAAGETIEGTWEGDFLNKKIAASFPDGSVPLENITGEWKITDNNWTNVHAAAGNPDRKMHLKKK